VTPPPLTITLKNIKTRARKSASASTSGSGTGTGGDGFAYTPAQFGDYFILILKILAGFIVFCWVSTSNYLNTTSIDTNASYPIFGKKQVREAGTPVERPHDSVLRRKGLSRFEDLGATTPAQYMSKQYVDTVDDNPYATRFTPVPIDMSNEAQIREKLVGLSGLSWWFERTQQSSYQVGGLILHKVFDVLRGFTTTIERESGNSTKVARIFASLLRLAFDLFTIGLFMSFLGLVWLLWIPGWLGGLTAFLPLAYFTNSAIWQLCKQGFILFWTFVWMCLFGWVTIFPVIWQFCYLIYLLFMKQLRDDPGKFGTEFLNRMQSLVWMYFLTAVIIALASTELPNATKITVGIVSGVLFLYKVYKWWQTA
jgi:hypothetical protein